MAKINVQVTLRTDAGVNLGNPIGSGDVATLTAAKAVIQTVIDQRVAAATQNATDYNDANNGFNS